MNRCLHGCKNLRQITANFTEWNESATSGWVADDRETIGTDNNYTSLSRVFSKSGQFINNHGLSGIYGENHIPPNWNYYSIKPLTFICKEVPSFIFLNTVKVTDTEEIMVDASTEYDQPGWNNFYEKLSGHIFYSLNNSNEWQQYQFNSRIILNNLDDTVSFKSDINLLNLYNNKQQAEIISDTDITTIDNPYLLRFKMFRKSIVSTEIFNH